jgi:hypothetical protein
MLCVAANTISLARRRDAREPPQGPDVDAAGTVHLVADGMWVPFNGLVMGLDRTRRYANVSSLRGMRRGAAGGAAARFGRGAGPNARPA